jgi:hypothetical protein
MNHPKRIGTLLFRYNRHELTDQEKRELAEWRALSADNEQLFRDKTDPEKVRKEMTALYDSRDQVFQQIRGSYPGIANAKLSDQDFPESGADKKPARIFHVSRRAAAILIVVMGASLYFILRGTGLIGRHEGNSYEAVFVSPEGVEITLDDIHRGFLAGSAGITFKKNEKGELDYIASNNSGAARDKHYALRSKKGGHFKLNLPGSAWIWFNSATTIQYPANLSQDTLQVQLNGEAYFEVERDSAHPVIISLPSTVNRQPSTNNLPSTVNRQPSTNTLPSTVNRQPSTEIKIESSNARFNVKAYTDSSMVFITAVSGNVSLQIDSLNGKPPSTVPLFPGQQAQISRGNMTIARNTDTKKITAWKKW